MPESDGGGPAGFVNLKILRKILCLHLKREQIGMNKCYYVHYIQNRAIAYAGLRYGAMRFIRDGLTQDCMCKPKTLIGFRFLFIVCRKNQCGCIAFR